MTLEEIEQAAWRPQVGFYRLYHGQEQTGTVFKGMSKASNLSAFFFVKRDDWMTGQPTPTDDWLQKNGKEIRHPSEINRVHQLNSNGGASYSTHHHPYLFTKLIVIGAGASYDFDSSKPESGVFPLANHLFKCDHLVTMDQYPGVVNLANDLSLTKNIEAFLQKEWNKILKSYNPDRLAEIINIQYYLHDVFLVLSARNKKHIWSNYRSLAKAIKDWSLHQIENNSNERIAIMNYNYDLMLDYALQTTFNFTYHSIDDYMDCSQRPFILFKPHGSCNWIRKFANNTGGSTFHGINVNNFGSSDLHGLARHVYTNKLDYSLLYNNVEDKIILAREEEDELLQPRVGGAPQYNSARIKRPYLPHLLLPFNEKDEFVMPNAHTQTLNEILPHTNQVLVIGWKGEERKMTDLFKKHFYGREVSFEIVNGKIKGVGGGMKKTSIHDMDTREAVRVGVPQFANQFDFSSWEVHSSGFTQYAGALANDKATYFQV